MATVETAFLDALYAGVTDDGALDRALSQLQKMFDCAAGAFVSFDARAPAIDLTLTSGVFLEHGADYLRDFVAIDPAPAAFAKLPAGSATTTDRLLPPEVIASDPFHHEFFRKIGLEETLGGTLFCDRARFSLIGLQRGNDRRPFDDSDMASLERLMPHIARVLQLRRAFVGLRSQNLALQQAIDRLAAGAILFDADGNASFVNKAMTALARQGGGLSLDRQGRLLPTNLDARKRLYELLADVAGGGPGGVFRVPRPNGSRDCVVLVAPQPAPEGARGDNGARNGAILLVHDPDGENPTDAELLAAGFGLTPGAARLLAALAANDDLRSYAERVAITIHTARFHLRTALTRTGARTQAELVRLAVRLLRDLDSRPNGQ
jgi:DNA-binding CsgD family transcriptional regulator